MNIFKDVMEVCGPECPKCQGELNGWQDDYPDQLDAMVKAKETIVQCYSTIFTRPCYKKQSMKYVGKFMKVFLRVHHGIISPE